MAGEKLKLPKLPPGKRIEQVLAMEESDFAEIARNAGMTPVKLRDTLEKILARSTPAGQKTEEEVTARKARERRETKVIRGDRAPKVFSAEAGFREGLRRFLFEDERGATEADEQQAFVRADGFGQNAASERHATRLYRAAYRIRLMRRLEHSLKGNETQSALEHAHRLITERALLEQRSVNFNAQREGYFLAVEDFQTLASDKRNEVRALYDALKNGAPLTPSQKKLMEGIMYRSSDYDRSFYLLMSAVAHVFDENGIREGRMGVAVGGMSGFSGSFEYSPHSRPHRDDHGASGGDDDK